MLPIAPRTNCTKRLDEYCRIHNPIAKPAHSFSSVDEVFDKADGEIEKLKVKQELPLPGKQPPFQGPDETRVLDEGVPARILDHIAQNEQELSHLSDEQKLAIRNYTGPTAAVCNAILRGESRSYSDGAEPWREADRIFKFHDREDLVDYLQTMDDALAPRQKDSRILYRGVPFYPELRKKMGDLIGKELHPSNTEGLVDGLKEFYKVGKVIDTSSYLSTSASPLIAADAAVNSSDGVDEDGSFNQIRGVQFELKTNAGLDVVSAATKPFRKEREVLLPRGTHFKITNVYIKPISYETVSGYDNKDRPDILTTRSFYGLGAIVQMVEVDSNGNEITHTNPHKPSASVESLISK